MKQITAAETPLQLVEKYRRKYSFKDTYDAMDDAKDKLVEAFPECFCDWCQMPIAVPTNLLATAGYTPIECVRDGASLSACYLWRQYKIIYDFAGPLAEELAQQAFDVSALDTLPMSLPPYSYHFAKRCRCICLDRARCQYATGRATDRDCL